MGTGFKMLFVITHLIVSKAGFKLVVPTTNATGMGRQGLRDSPKLRWGLEKCCLAEIGKLVLSGCTPWSLMSRLADHKKPQRRDLCGCKHSPSDGLALHRAKLISAATERHVMSLWSFLRRCKVILTVGFSSFLLSFPFIFFFSLLQWNAEIWDCIHMELKHAGGWRGGGAGPAQSPNLCWQLQAGTEQCPLPGWQSPPLPCPSS